MAAHIVDVGEKRHVARSARAQGFLLLSPTTCSAITNGQVPKGDVCLVAQVAGLQAVKRTPELLPLCHPLPITGADVDVDVTAEGIRAVATVTTTYQTGVEMEALCGVTTALLCAWDMVKALEKDESGQYPSTRMQDIRVLSKTKDSPP